MGKTLTLQELLEKQIHLQADQSINYEQYMKTVLYHPEHGFYNRCKSPFGKNGDFFTSPMVHPVFGHVLARFFVDVMEREGLPPTICEMGGGNGRLAKAILQEWKQIAPTTYRHLHYYIVEPSRFQREEPIFYDSHVKPFESFEQLQDEHPGFFGILFSNEWLDALPVRVVQKSHSKLYEVKITMNEKDQLTEVHQNCQDSDILGWLEKVDFPIHEGQRVEIPLVMTDILKKTAKWMQRGVILHIDYGFTKEEWLAPQRKEGSLRGYVHHQMVKDPLQYPGEMDLTSHVHLDVVDRILGEKGWTHHFTMPQRDFLLASGILDHLAESNDTNLFSDGWRTNRAIHTFISGEIGTAFQVMMYGKSLKYPVCDDWMDDDPVQKAIKKRG